MATRAKPVEIESSIVRWARESVGLTIEQAAKKLGIKPEKLEKWEESSARPTPRQLENMADKFKRPVAAFFLREPPQEPPLPTDFRVLPDIGASELKFETRIALRRARRLQKVFAELSHEERDLETRVPTAQPSDDPEEVAREARRLVGVSVEDQLQWPRPLDALRTWRTAVEQLGVLVFQFSFPREDARGFSLSNSVPTIALSTKDAEVARLFTLFHELAHFILGRPGVCIPDEGAKSASVGDVETFCNAFAGAFLVPADALLEAVEARQGFAPTDDEITETAGNFSVSRYVVLRRLLTLGLISLGRYQRTAEAWSQQPPLPKKTKGSGGPHPALIALSELGTSFVSNILEWHAQGRVTDIETADYLSLRLQHLDRLQELLLV